MANFILITSYIILVYFGALTAGYCILLIASLPGIFKQCKEIEFGNPDHLVKSLIREPILTILVPIYNEKLRALNTIYSILKSDCLPVNIILINDGSTDNTLSILKEELLLYPVPTVVKQTIKTKPIRQVYQSELYTNVMVIDKEHGYGSGADSVNVGINACITPLYMTVDADTVLEPEAISRLLYAFFSKPHCISVGGAVYVLNENKVVDGELLESHLPSSYIPAFQAIEYVRSFLFSRTGWNFFYGALCYAGAFTLYEKQVVVDIGGYDSRNFSYDAEVIVNMHRYMRINKFPYSIYFASNAFAWTIVPSTLKSYWRQRNFWQRGMLRSFMKHINMCLNPRYGVVGMFNVVFNFLFEIMGPVVEFISYLLVVLAYFYNILALVPILWALFLAWGFAAFLNLANFLLNIATYNKYHSVTDILRVFYLVFAEMIGFRQFRATCCFVATVQYFWNRMRGRYL